MTAALAVFAALLVSPALAQPQDREIVKVNGTPIRQSEVVERMWRRYGPDTLEELVDELLLRQAVAADKIKVDAAQVDARFARLRKQFGGDEKAFAAQLEQMGKTPDKVKTELEDQLKFERLIMSRKKVSVTDADLKKAFDQHKGELGMPEGVQLRHILVATKPEADDVISRVKGGADFKKVAAEKSLAPTGKINGGDYGWVARGMLPSDIEKAAFSMKEGELKVVASDKGQHVLQVLGKRAAAPAEFSQVKEDLRDAVTQEKIRAALPALVKDLREKADIQPHREN